MTVAKPCPCCGRRPELATSYLTTCRCARCYDGTEDAHPGSQLCGFGHSAAEAVESWNDAVRDHAEANGTDEVSA